MGCCPSKSAGSADKEYVAAPDDVDVVVPSDFVEHRVGVDNEAQDMLMDRSEGDNQDEPTFEPVGDSVSPPLELKLKLPPENQAASVAPDEVLRVPEAVSIHSQQPPLLAPRKSSLSADDIPISTIYHRVHSAEVEEQEAKRREELRLEAEQHEREVREYKAAMQV